MKRYILLITMIITANIVLQAQSFKVIVNNNNPNTTLSTGELSSIFLKKTSKWSNGEKVVPVDLNADSPIREAFSKNVHKKSVGSIKSYWQQYVFAGSGTPPVEKNSDTEVVEFVKKNTGAIGYISSGADASGVKVITVN
ncbi:MAG: phosphate ABC transporter substrate-binding protein [Bacteroidales bacterium]|nr:MAG: phosphate ABC transporter substrate-binding protein [Bacteroidales bacterium]